MDRLAVSQMAARHVIHLGAEGVREAPGAAYPGVRRMPEPERSGGVGMRHTAEYVGGPLDGRSEPLPPTKSFVGNIVTHIFLHGGPKIETRYRLDRTEEGRWVYRLDDGSE
jgi:hypothetical protein